MELLPLRREVSPFDQLYHNPKLEGGLSHWSVRGRQKVRHLDVVEFDRDAYCGRPVQPGAAGIVRCYAVYSPTNKDVLLYAYPGSDAPFSDNLTKARAKHCRVIGSVYDDHHLYLELRALLNA